MWLSIVVGLFVGALIYLTVMTIITLISRKRKKKHNNDIEE